MIGINVLDLNIFNDGYCMEQVKSLFLVFLGSNWPASMLSGMACSSEWSRPLSSLLLSSWSSVWTIRVQEVVGSTGNSTSVPHSLLRMPWAMLFISCRNGHWARTCNSFSIHHGLTFSAAPTQLGLLQVFLKLFMQKKQVYWSLLVVGKQKLIMFGETIL